MDRKCITPQRLLDHEGRLLEPSWANKRMFEYCIYCFVLQFIQNQIAPGRDFFQPFSGKIAAVCQAGNNGGQPFFGGEQIRGVAAIIFVEKQSPFQS